MSAASVSPDSPRSPQAPEESPPPPTESPPVAADEARESTPPDTQQPQQQQSAVPDDGEEANYDDETFSKKSSVSSRSSSSRSSRSSSRGSNAEPSPRSVKSSDSQSSTESPPPPSAAAQKPAEPAPKPVPSYLRPTKATERRNDKSVKEERPSRGLFPPLKPLPPKRPATGGTNRPAGAKAAARPQSGASTNPAVPLQPLVPPRTPRAYVPNPKGSIFHANDGKVKNENNHDRPDWNSTGNPHETSLPHYNGLLDRCLASYFSAPSRKKWLVDGGIVTEDGRIVRLDQQFGRVVVAQQVFRTVEDEEVKRQRDADILIQQLKKLNAAGVSKRAQFAQVAKAREHFSLKRQQPPPASTAVAAESTQTGDDSPRVITAAPADNAARKESPTRIREDDRHYPRPGSASSRATSSRSPSLSSASSRSSRASSSLPSSHHQSRSHSPSSPL